MNETVRGISIRDADDRDVLTVDLKDILRVVGGPALQSQWLIHGADITGEAAATELNRVSDAGEFIDGEMLLQLSNDVWQTVDGKFEAFR